ncbi:hypothetical protein ACRAKI_09695 [Saccharothrix isguenensis]
MRRVIPAKPCSRMGSIPVFGIGGEHCLEHRVSVTQRWGNYRGCSMLDRRERSLRPDA